MRMNGVMIDCSRLLERKSYYFKMVDFMAEWGMDTLLFHFCDDHGCSIKLPGFEKLAMPRAFTTKEIGELVKYASGRGIAVIPEMETFGHTRFITDRKEYSHLKAGSEKDNRLGFNAIDPLSAESRTLMRALITVTASLFPSKYLHIGGDEVNLESYCRTRGLHEDIVWADYINEMIRLTKEAGKLPMMWADHPSKSDAVAARLRKDVVQVIWQYLNGQTKNVEASIKMLQKHGFKKLILAPSVACFRYRFQPCSIAFQNMDEMISLAHRHKVFGVINTIWCPHRYLQNTLYYPLAYGSVSVRRGGAPAKKRFNARFAAEFFGLEANPDLEAFLGLWPKMKMLNNWTTLLQERNYGKLCEQQIAELESIGETGVELLKRAEVITPSKNKRVFKAMVLSAKGVMLCAERLVLGWRKEKVGARQKNQFRLRVNELRAEMSAEWDRTRFPGDNRKYHAFLQQDKGHSILILLKQLEPLR